ncbi:MAG: PDZ domain-containing protein [bacterium]
MIPYNSSFSKKVVVGFAVLAFSLMVAVQCCWSQSVAKEKVPDEIRQAIDRAVAQVYPALVRIHVVEVDYWSGKEQKSEAAGSGVIISPEGYVITNHHVAGKTKQIICTLANKEEVEAELVGTDALADIAVIKLKTDGTRKFPYAQFGDSSKVQVGDYVLAMGSPYALSQSVTMGIISNTALTMPDLFWNEKFTMEGEDVGSIVRWIGHDAAIYGGNSGGPLVNLQGEIIGINEMDIGLSGAIPGNLAKSIAEELIKNKKIVRSWIGIEIQPLLKYSDQKKGILIAGTVEGAPAEQAGFKSGDILLRFAGQDITVRFAEELPTFNLLIANLPIGKEYEAVVLRDGKEQTLKVTTKEREEARPKQREIKEWGITVRDISFLMQKALKRDNRNGIFITSMRSGGPSDEAKPSINERDVLVAVDSTPVNNVKELVALTEKIVAGQKEPVPVVVAFDRKAERYLTVVKVGIKQLEDPGLEVKKAWVPIATQVLTKDLAKGLGLEGKTGVRITQVYPDTVAEKAGLKVGDIILALDGDKIAASQPEDFEVFPTMVRQYKIGATAELTVLRDNEELKIPIVLPASPKLAREMKKYRNDTFDFTVRDIGFLDKAKEKWQEEQRGVLVESVGEGGWAALSHLAVDDLVLSVNGQKIAELADMEKIMKQVETEKPNSVVLQVMRGIHKLYIELKPSWTTK